MAEFAEARGMARAHRQEACLDIWPVPLSRRLPIIRRAIRRVSASLGEGCILAHIHVSAVGSCGRRCRVMVQEGEER